jgi:hypothetical protein
MRNMRKPTGEDHIRSLNTKSEMNWLLYVVVVILIGFTSNEKWWVPKQQLTQVSFECNNCDIGYKHVCCW